MNDILFFALMFLFLILDVFCAAYLAVILALRQTKFRIEQTTANGKTKVQIVPDLPPNKPVEFIDEPTQSTLDEINQDPQWKRFLRGFSKS